MYVYVYIMSCVCIIYTHMTLPVICDHTHDITSIFDHNDNRDYVWSHFRSDFQEKAIFSYQKAKW